jgi:hypothetical protein
MKSLIFLPFAVLLGILIGVGRRKKNCGLSVKNWTHYAKKPTVVKKTHVSMRSPAWFKSQSGPQRRLRPNRLTPKGA